MFTQVMRVVMLLIGAGLIIAGVACFIGGAIVANNEMLLEAFGSVILPIVLYSVGPLIAFCGLLKILYTFTGNRKLTWCVWLFFYFCQTIVNNSFWLLKSHFF